jgi:hypothetical protein
MDVVMIVEPMTVPDVVSMLAVAVVSKEVNGPSDIATDVVVGSLDVWVRVCVEIEIVEIPIKVECEPVDASTEVTEVSLPVTDEVTTAVAELVVTSLAVASVVKVVSATDEELAGTCVALVAVWSAMAVVDSCMTDVSVGVELTGVSVLLVAAVSADDVAS